MGGDSQSNFEVKWYKAIAYIKGMGPDPWSIGWIGESTDSFRLEVAIPKHL